MNIPEVIVSKLTYTIAAFFIVAGIRILVRSFLNIFFVRMQSRVSSDKLISKTLTLRSLIQHSLDAVIFTITILMILAYWGVNIFPLITSAGIIGLAISFGSQTLVKDIISGIFIILEDQYNVGDRVKIIDKYEGKVTKITLRLTVLKTDEGHYIYIPNSQIISVERFPQQKK